MPSIVGICPVCGKHIIADNPQAKKKKKYCSKLCCNRANYIRRRAARANERKSVRANRRQQLEEMRARLAARDEAYAKVAPKTTVEVVDGRRIETRGNKIIGVRAASFKWHA